MKKILIVFSLFLITSVLMCGCSKDEEDGYNIVGMWKATNSYKWVYLFNPDNTYTFWVDDYDESIYDKEPREKGTYSFDGTYLSLNGGFKKEVEFSEDGNKCHWGNGYFIRVK